VLNEVCHGLDVTIIVYTLIGNLVTCAVEHEDDVASFNSAIKPILAAKLCHSAYICFQLLRSGLFSFIASRINTFTKFF